MKDIACCLINYRNPEDTLACIRSLKAAGAGAFKVFLVNNHSADGSAAPLRRGLEESGMAHAYLEPGANLGFTGGVNLAARAALEEGFRRILLLNNDTEVAADFAVRLVRAAEEDPGSVIAGRVVEHADGSPTWNIGRLSPWTGQVVHVFDPAYAGKVEFVSGCLMLVPAEAFRKVGLLDERYFMYCEDFEFCLRLREAGIPIRYRPEILVRHKTSSATRRSSFPKEYYRVRNLTHAVLSHARWPQKAGYLAFLALMMPYKLVRRPGLFLQAARGAWDGLGGRLGVRNGGKSP